MSTERRDAINDKHDIREREYRRQTEFCFLSDRQIIGNSSIGTVNWDTRDRIIMPNKKLRRCRLIDLVLEE